MFKYKDNKITKYNFACLVLYRLQPGFLPCSPPALLSWDGWANSLPRPTCCYHEWKAVVETKVNGHWNKLTFFYTLSSTVVRLYLDALSCSKFHLQPHILTSEEKAWTVFSGALEAGAVFLLSSWQEVSVFIIWPQFLWWLGVFPNNNDNKLWESKLDYF